MSAALVLCVEDDPDTRHLLNRASGADTPIVFFSGHASRSDVEAGMHAGANAYIVKPDTREVVPTVRRLLARAPAADSRPLQSSN